MNSSRPPSWKWSVCLLLLFATMLLYMDRQTLSLTGTRMKQEFHLDDAQYGRLEAGFSWAFALGALFLFNHPGGALFAGHLPTVYTVLPKGQLAGGSELQLCNAARLIPVLFLPGPWRPQQVHRRGKGQHHSNRRPNDIDTDQIKSSPIQMRLLLLERVQCQTMD